MQLSKFTYNNVFQIEYIYINVIQSNEIDKAYIIILFDVLNMAV